MARPRPLKRINLPLRDGVSLTLVVWRNEHDLRIATETNHDAVFCERPDGPHIGELHIERGTPPELIAHELRHAIDYFNYRQHTERSARMTQECMETIEVVMDDL